MTRRGSNNRDGNGVSGHSLPSPHLRNCPASPRNASPSWDGDHRASLPSPTSDDHRTGRAFSAGPSADRSDLASQPSGQQAVGRSHVARTRWDDHAGRIADTLPCTACPRVDDVLDRVCGKHPSACLPRQDPTGLRVARHIPGCLSGAVAGLVTALRDDDELYAAVRDAYAAIAGRVIESRPSTAEQVEQVARHLNKEGIDA